MSIIFKKKQTFSDPGLFLIKRGYCSENQGWCFLNLCFLYAAHYCINGHVLEGKECGVNPDSQISHENESVVTVSSCRRSK